MNISAGTGHDLIELRTIDVLGALVIDADAGNNQILVNQSSAIALHVFTAAEQDRVHVLLGSYGGDVLIRTGEGNDDVALIGVEAGTIDLGMAGGDDTVTVALVTFDRRIRFAGGRDHDTVRYLADKFDPEYFTALEVLQIVERPVLQIVERPVR